MNWLGTHMHYRGMPAKVDFGQLSAEFGIAYDGKIRVYVGMPGRLMRHADGQLTDAHGYETLPPTTTWFDLAASLERCWERTQIGEPA